MATSTVTLHNPKTASAAVLIAVFLCGSVAGALLMSVTGVHKTLHGRATWGESRPVILEHWKKELDLSPKQTEQLESILDDFSKYYDNVLADGKTRVMGILDDRQKRKFDELLKNSTP